MKQSPLKNHDNLLQSKRNLLRFYTLIALFLMTAIQTAIILFTDSFDSVSSYYTIYLIITGSLVLIVSLTYAFIKNKAVTKITFMVVGVIFYAASILNFYETSLITIALILLVFVVVEVVTLERLGLIVYIVLSFFGSILYLTSDMTALEGNILSKLIRMLLPLLLTLLVGFLGISLLKNNQDTLTDTIIAINQDRQEMKKLNKAFAEAEIEIRQQFEKIYDQAYKDMTTDLHNKYYLMEILNMMYQENYPFSLLMISCNDFRMDEDHHKRNISHDIIIHMAENLKRLNDKRFEIGHFQGDFFYAIIDNVDDATEFANAYADLYSNPIATASINLSLTIHIGIYDYEPGDTPNDAVKYAEIAMYQAKKEKPEGFTTFSKDMLI